ncbi:MAG: ABC transporter substrate-binding protein [Bacteroidia bacterium]|nr:ABC transporter substrate-binding protein [Bacteroidia bacterium]MDW8235859.1 ABC transporter substrate-binding protein [Bacteroidia bacterium]
MRWVSLSPETTLWIDVLGKKSSLIGRSHFCREPAWAAQLPICTRMGEPQDWEQYLMPYLPDFRTISSLKPEGVLVSLESPPPDFSPQQIQTLLQKAVGYSVRLHSVYAESCANLSAPLRALGEALGAPNQANRWIDQAQATLKRLRSQAGSLAPLRVAIVSEDFPVHPLSPWTISVLHEVKLTAIHANRLLTLEKLLEEDPDLVIWSTKGYGIEEAGMQLARWASYPPIQSLSAFRKKRLYAFKGITGLFYLSPQLPQTWEALYELAHTPYARSNRHIGRVWSPLL